MPASGSGFEHEAFFYDDLDGFVAGASAFIRDGLEGDESVLVLVAPPKITALHDVLGADADSVVFADMAVVGANPARIIPAWREFLEGSAADRPARGIGEPIHAGLTPPQLAEAQLHEDLLNLAFADVDAMRLLCPYDAALPTPVLDEAHRSHPFVSGAAVPCTHAHHSPPFVAPPLAEPRAVGLVLDYELASLGRVRAALRSHARSAGLPAERIDALVLAASELATNSIEHGGGSGHLRAWRDGDAVVCEFHDAGWITDPLVGRARPRADAVAGRGLWLANQVCDLVQVRSDRTTGTTIRLHVGPG